MPVEGPIGIGHCSGQSGARGFARMRAIQKCAQCRGAKISQIEKMALRHHASPTC
jgi:hypothetical protein